MSQRSGYARLLRLRHIDLNGYLSLVLFEGSAAVALLLAYAGLMDPWGVAAVPVAVAVMVKFHDVITGVLARPAVAAQLRRPQPQIAVGRSPVPRPSRPTTWIEPDDAVRYSPAAHDEPDPVARAVAQDVVRGVATVPAKPDGRRPPAPTVRPGGVALPVSAAPAAEDSVDAIDDGEVTETVTGTGALSYNTAAMRMRGNQGRFG
jgi:hypothetical protein